MTRCKYDRESGEYRIDDKPCLVDDYGDPTKHCTARRSCTNHIGPDELTCATCLGRTRANLRRIAEISPLMLNVAMSAGVDSEAANLAGPAADPEAWVWRKVAARQGKAWHVSLVEDDDELHPYVVLGRWDMMIREDYDHPSDDPVTVTNAAAYLERQLPRMAHDEAQDWPLFAREIRKVRQHLEAVLRNSDRPDRGAPCPECTNDDSGVGPRLVREYGHWCDDDECCRLHYADDSGDRWVCPRDRGHWWDAETYSRWIEDRQEHTRRGRVEA